MAHGKLKLGTPSTPEKITRSRQGAAALGGNPNFTSTHPLTRNRSK